MRLMLLTVLALGTSGLFRPATPTAVASAQPLAIEDATGVRELQVQGRLAAISPDSHMVAYTRCDPRRIAIRPAAETSSALTLFSEGCDIWLTDTDTRVARNLTESQGSNWGPSWSRDGTRLAFYSDRTGQPRLWIWDRRNGSSRQVSTAITYTRYGFEVPLWTAGDTALIAKLRPEHEQGDPAAAATASVSGFAPNDGAGRSSVKVFHAGRDAAGVTADHQPPDRLVSQYPVADLGSVDLSDGQVRRLARRVGTLTYQLSPAGTSLLWTESHGRPGKTSVECHALNVVSLPDGHARELVPHVGFSFDGAMNWSPDGSLIAFVSAAHGNHGAGDGLFVVSPSGGPVRQFRGTPAGALQVDFVRPLWNAASTEIYTIGDKRIWRGTLNTLTLDRLPSAAAMEPTYVLAAADTVRAWAPHNAAPITVMAVDRTTQLEGLYRISGSDADGTWVLREDKKISYLFEPAVTAPDGTYVVYLSQSATEPPDLWTVSADGRTRSRLTTLNPELEKYTFGETRSVDFLSLEGQPHKATLLLPTDYDTARRYPLVVWVYASRLGSRGRHYFGLTGAGGAYNLQLLASRGYAVLWPDVPTVSVGAPIRDLVNAVMPAIDRLVALGIADADRLGVMGQSHGGYSTLALLTQTRRFKAAVMNAGYGNLAAVYGAMTPAGTGQWQNSLETGPASLGAPPWVVPHVYVQNSPVFFLDRVTTPLLIQAGADDTGIVPYSDEVFVGLKRLEKDVVYLRYGDEHHVLSAYVNLVDYWERVLKFFGHYLAPSAP